jgi:hypothetical protein
MYDIIPEAILDRIGASYERAIRRAQSRYGQWQRDEDYASGAVGGTMEELVKGTTTVNGSTYRWNTTTWPVRGKGPRSPETEYGADAVIEIVLRNEVGETVTSKILPIQNKKEKIYSNRTLAKQADRLSKLPGGGLIVSFSEHGFMSCEAHVVAEANGKWTTIPENLKRDFGDMLAKDFLSCKIGSRDLVYDARREVFHTVDGRDIRLRVRRRIRTLIKKNPR